MSLNYRKLGKIGIRINSIDRLGYFHVRLHGLTGKKNYLVHQLVAKSFIPNPENKPTVNHRDGNPSNNNVDNLEWNTYIENTRHSYNVLGRKNSFGIDHPLSRPVNQISKDGEFIKKWDFINEVEQKLNFCHSAIVRCCIGQRPSAYGFRWEYATI